MQNWKVWNRTVSIKTILILNWIVWKRTVYLNKKGFGIKELIKFDMP